MGSWSMLEWSSFGLVMLVAVSEMWPLKQWNSDLWLATTPATEHLQEPIRSNLVRAASLQYFSKVSTEAPEDGDGLLLEEEQGVGVCGHSRVSSDVEVVAVIAVGVVCLNYTAFLPYGATFAPTCCSVCRFFFLFLSACLIRHVTWHQAWPPWQLCLKTSETLRTLQLLPTCGHRICE